MGMSFLVVVGNNAIHGLSDNFPIMIRACAQRFDGIPPLVVFIGDFVGYGVIAFVIDL